MNQFSKDFFTGNRKQLCDLLPQTVVLVPANSLLQSSADLAFPFRQDSSFWYLCGIDEPDAVLVIDAVNRKSRLLLPERSDFHDEWDGAYDTVAIQEISGVDAVEIVKMEPVIARITSEAVKNDIKIGYLKPLDERVEPYGLYSNPARRIVLRTLTSTTDEESLVDVRVPIAKLRQVKQQCEVDAIQQAIDVTADALDTVKSQLQSFENEKDIERALSAHFYGKADGHAYEPIIAGGKNAAVIHYTSNSQSLEPGDLMLLDVGALHNRYAADISRTWSIGTGAPTQRQKDIHAHVLQVQHYAMGLLKPGVMLREYQKQVEEYHNKQAKKLGIEADNYPHGISHFLGLDVHDAGDYSEPLVEGTVLTVEPGIYLPDEGIGVRIEDDIIITSDGMRNLSARISTDL